MAAGDRTATQDPRDRFDVASIPGLRARISEAYKVFRAAEAAINEVRAPPSHGGQFGGYRNRPCPACGTTSPSSTVVLGRYGITVAECHCGFAYAPEVLSDQEDARRYVASDIDSATMKLRDCAEYRQLEDDRSDYYLDLIERSGAPRGRLLEIGCGSGTFLLRAASRGWQTLGIEPGRVAFLHARSRRANVIQGFFPSDVKNGEHFGAVVMLDVLEHIVDPLPFLRHVHNVLVDGGILFIQVPNWESLLVRIEGGNSTIVAPGHWSYFTGPTLKRLTEAAGFSVLACETVVSELDRILQYGERYKEVFRQLRPSRSVPDRLTAGDLYDAGLAYKLVALLEKR